MLARPAAAPASDEDLACRAQQGCLASFEELLRRFQTPVLQFLRRRGFAADAEDLAQETFCRAYENLHRYDSRWTFSVWLFTIAHRTGLNYRRRKRPIADTAAVASAPSNVAEPLDTLVIAEGRQRLWDVAASELPEEQFTALWLHYVEDMPLAGIAVVLGRTRASTKIMMFRARRRLLPLFNEFDDQRRPQPLLAAREAADV